jgi:hypothetical protein
MTTKAEREYWRERKQKNRRINLAELKERISHAIAVTEIERDYILRAVIYYEHGLREPKGGGWHPGVALDVTAEAWMVVGARLGIGLKTRKVHSETWKPGLPLRTASPHY